MKYFIKAHWWRACHAWPTQSTNLVIAEEPDAWLTRMRARLGDEWTGIQIDNCCQVSADTIASPDPYLGEKSLPPTPEQIRKENKILGVVFGIILVIAAYAVGIHYGIL